MNIISIDSSKANVGIFIKSDKEIYLTINTSKKKSLAEKYLYIRNEIKRLCKENKIDFAFVEDYTYSIKRSQSVTTLAEVKGIIFVTLFELNIDIIKINPSTWKCLIKLNLPDKNNKKNYINYVNKFYKKEFKTTDECDAYMMLLAAYYIYQGVTKTDGHVMLQKKMKAIGEIF